jgi:hypothetical protein
MKPTKKKLYWRIEGRDSSTLFFERTVEHGQFTVSQIDYLLMALAAKAGLDYNEIVSLQCEPPREVFVEK